MDRASRNQSLDVLRGIAILLVLGYHYHQYVRFWGRIGWSGVDLFFVLSGFLISGLLFGEYKRSGRIDVARFLIRRGFKIYPPFYVLMAYTVVDSLLVRKHELGSIWGDLLFLQNYCPHVWAHGWSLAVEEHFYWLLPLLLLLMIAKSSNKENPFGGIPWTFLVVAVGCLSLRAFELSRGVSVTAVQSQTHLRIDSLFFGVLLSYCRHFRPELFRRIATKPLWIPGTLLLMVAFHFPLGSTATATFGLTCIYLGFGCIMVWAVDRHSASLPGARALAWTGRYSYSIYLWHLPIGFLLFTGSPTLPLFILYTALAIGVGAGMSRLVEIPHLALRDRLFPARSAQSAVAPIAEQPAPEAQLATG